MNYSEIIGSVGWPVYLLLSLYIALQFIQVPDCINRAFHYVALVVGT
jgi:hypothetical protein